MSLLNNFAILWLKDCSGVLASKLSGLGAYIERRIVAAESGDHTVTRDKTNTVAVEPCSGRAKLFRSPKPQQRLQRMFVVTAARSVEESTCLSLVYCRLESKYTSWIMTIKKETSVAKNLSITASLSCTEIASRKCIFFLICGSIKKHMRSKLFWDIRVKLLIVSSTASN